MSSSPSETPSPLSAPLSDRSEPPSSSPDPESPPELVETLMSSACTSPSPMSLSEVVSSSSPPPTPCSSALPTSNGGTCPPGATCCAIPPGAAPRGTPEAATVAPAPALALALALAPALAPAPAPALALARAPAPAPAVGETTCRCLSYGDMSSSAHTKDTTVPFTRRLTRAVSLALHTPRVAHRVSAAHACLPHRQHHVRTACVLAPTWTLRRTPRGAPPNPAQMPPRSRCRSHHAPTPCSARR